MKGVYGATNELSNTPNRSMDAVKDKDGKLLTTEEQVKKRREEHFSEVLNRAVPETQAVIEEAMDRELDIMMGVYHEGVANGKSAGVDAVTTEVLNI